MTGEPRGAAETALGWPACRGEVMVTGRGEFLDTDEIAADGSFSICGKTVVYERYSRNLQVADLSRKHVDSLLPMDLKRIAAAPSICNVPTMSGAIGACQPRRNAVWRHLMMM